MRVEGIGGESVPTYGHPATYERNEAYFEWRRIERLATAHSSDRLRERLSELTARIEGYEDRFGTVGPEAVDAVEAAKVDDRSIDDVYSDLADWTTALEARNRYGQARQRRVAKDG